MTIDLSHADALRLAEQSGELIAAAFGPPDLVIGIDRAGIPVAALLARGSEAADMVVVSRKRTTSQGRFAGLRSSLRATTPRRVRRLYKRLFFRKIVRVVRSSRARKPAQEPAQHLVLAIASAPCPTDGLIVVADDAIDSGGTMEEVIAATVAAHPLAQVVAFALTSTAGHVVHRDQITVFEDIVEFAEGDLGDIAHHYTDDGWRPQTRGPSQDPSPVKRRPLYLDLDGTLVTDSFEAAFRTAIAVLPRHGDRASAVRLRAVRRLELLRIGSHSKVKRALDDAIRGMNPEAAADFQADLVANLRNQVRVALHVLATAPRVEGNIVTAALASYADAVEQAFGLPVLCGSESTDTGWSEVDASAKSAVICADLDANHPAGSAGLLIGDTFIDGSSASARVPVALVPAWDRTGMLTLLGCWRQ
jgi:adenine/guanine phosphoribosyltransferase-like PRPP-binding protein